jgi:hypothetical protein
MKETRLDDTQLERLCALVYLEELLTHQSMGDLGEIMRYTAESGLQGELPCMMSRQEWLRVLTGALYDPLLRALRITQTEDIAKDVPGGAKAGHRAFAFEDAKGHVYAIFRGTSGDGEWHDNALGMTEADTPQQRAALGFVESLGRRPVTVAGHSKGGNKAMYVALTAPPGMVGYCLSVDGQGFSPAFIAREQSVIKSRAPLITRMAERRDYVHCLGIGITGAELQYYSGWRDGFPLPYFHCPDALRAYNGDMGKPEGFAPLPAMLNALTVYFLQSPRYAATRHKTSVDLMSLMMAHKETSPDETAKALATVGLVFMDLINNDPSFRQRTEDVFLYEAELLTATLENAKGSQGGDMLPRVARLLAQTVITDASMRRDFLGTLRYLQLLTLKLRKQQRLREYVTAFVIAARRNSRTNAVK